MKPKSSTKVPAHFFAKDPRLAALMIGGRLASLVLANVAMINLWQADIATSIQLGVTALLALIGGVSLQNLALVGHEGGHFNLHRNRLTSARIGVLVSSVVPMHFDTGFSVSHGTHHRHTNTEKDPDLMLFTTYRSLLARMFLARLHASRSYLKKTLALALGKPAPDDLHATTLQLNDLIGLARLNLMTATAMLGIYALIISYVGVPAMIAFGSSYIVAIILSGIRPYLEHVDTDSVRISSARTWTSPLLDLVFAGINYHTAHHLYPGVPSYKIRQFHQWLVENQVLDLQQFPYVEGMRATAAVLINGKAYGPATASGGLRPPNFAVS